jgi:hypothetical protein
MPLTDSANGYLTGSEKSRVVVGDVLLLGSSDRVMVLYDAVRVPQ